MQMDLRTAREKCEWTQQQLADASDVSAATISRIEAGIITNPSTGTASKLEVALKLRRGTLKFAAPERATA